MTTRLNLKVFLGRIEELYQDLIEADLPYVDGWLELDIDRNSLETAKVAVLNMLREIEEDEQCKD